MHDAPSRDNSAAETKRACARYRRMLARYPERSLDPPLWRWARIIRFVVIRAARRRRRTATQRAPS